MTKLFSHQIFWNTIETSVFAYIKHLYSDSYCCKMWKLMRVHRCIALRFADILFLRAAWFRMAIAYNTILLSENHKILHCARCSSIASSCWEGNWFFVCDIDFFTDFIRKMKIDFLRIGLCISLEDWICLNVIKCSMCQYNRIISRNKLHYFN